MLADNLLPVVMQLCYFLGHRDENERNLLVLAKTGYALKTKVSRQQKAVNY